MTKRSNWFGVRPTANKSVAMITYPPRVVAKTQAHDLAAHLIATVGDWPAFLKAAREAWVSRNGLENLPRELAGLKKTVRRTMVVEVDADDHAEEVEGPVMPPGASPMTLAKSSQIHDLKERFNEEVPEATGNVCDLCGNPAAPPSTNRCQLALRGLPCEAKKATTSERVIEESEEDTEEGDEEAEG